MLECTPEAVVGLLPRLPETLHVDVKSNSGIYKWAPATNLRIDSDEYKALQGFYGPYYNIESINGEVKVLDQSIYVWPHELWQATGLVRNQMCKTIHITSLTAHLLGPRGETLDVVSTKVFVDRVRPGEPAPFIVKATISPVGVARVEWEVDYVFADDATTRNSRLEIYESDRDSGGSYSLFGGLHNLENTTAFGAHVIAAWLNQEGQVIYVAVPRLRSSLAELNSSLSLRAGSAGDFVYATEDDSLSSMLDGAKIMLWGIAK